ncbi:hypothetical protein Droror1_Dr00001750 [Drosera rotundifolia]
MQTMKELKLFPKTIDKSTDVSLVEPKKVIDEILQWSSATSIYVFHIQLGGNSIPHFRWLVEISSSKWSKSGLNKVNIDDSLFPLVGHFLQPSNKLTCLRQLFHTGYSSIQNTQPFAKQDRSSRQVLQKGTRFLHPTEESNMHWFKKHLM